MFSVRIASQEQWPELLSSINLNQIRVLRVDERERPPPRGEGLSRNPGGDLLSQGGTPKYHRRWWA